MITLIIRAVQCLYTSSKLPAGHERQTGLYHRHAEAQSSSHTHVLFLFLIQNICQTGMTHGSHTERRYTNKACGRIHASSESTTQLKDHGPRRSSHRRPRHAAWRAGDTQAAPSACSASSSVRAHKAAHAIAIGQDFDILETRVLAVAHGAQLLCHPLRLRAPGRLQQQHRVGARPHASAHSARCAGTKQGTRSCSRCWRVQRL